MTPEPAHNIQVIFSNEQQDVRIPAKLYLFLRRACQDVWAQEQFTGSARICIRLIDDQIMQRLNLAHRGIDAVTDMLILPTGKNGVYDKDLDTGALILGDIVLSLPRALHQAKLDGHSLQQRLVSLTVRAMLHLLGYNHETGGPESVRLREKEAGILSQLDRPLSLKHHA
ncbi:MAG: rRNA maturation RNase YbeY [Verrucomicrobiales bacterium]|jgi:probable rRNA maturation factor|nr:rRNA maturation RNase YbeY [Verrucomicrobiales bacterium]